MFICTLINLSLANHLVCTTIYITQRSEFFQKTSPQTPTPTAQSLALRNHIFGNIRPAKLPTKQAPPRSRPALSYSAHPGTSFPVSSSHEDSAVVPPYILPKTCKFNLHILKPHCPGCPSVLLKYAFVSLPPHSDGTYQSPARALCMNGRRVDGGDTEDEL